MDFDRAGLAMALLAIVLLFSARDAPPFPDPAAALQDGEAQLSAAKLDEAEGAFDWAAREARSQDERRRALQFLCKTRVLRDDALGARQALSWLQELEPDARMPSEAECWEAVSAAIKGRSS